MLITTANYIPDITVLKTFNPIVVNLVLGTNIFSDLNASFTDFFGGRSNSYEKRLNNLFIEAKTNLIEQCNRLGGNAIIGFSVNYNELSGKDKGMLMISIYGTPILLNQVVTENTISNVISSELFDHSINSYRIINKYSNKPLNPINKIDFEFIKKSNISELEDLVFQLITSDNLRIEDNGILSLANKEEFIFYYSNLPIHIKTGLMYRRLLESLSLGNKNIVRLYYNFIKTERNIDLDKIIEIVNNENFYNSIQFYRLALESKENYSKDDINKYTLLKDYFTRILNCFDVEIVTEKGFFGKNEKWICPDCSSKNDLEVKICTACNFRLNVLPNSRLSPQDYLTELEIRIEVLKNIFKEN